MEVSFYTDVVASLEHKTLHIWEFWRPKDEHQIFDLKGLEP